tara:strand:+ start:562 stop:840 length:279 start_codon:yes stop_codon:yes gene_type:complete
MQTNLREESERIKLLPGDMIVDITCNNVGILVERVRRISIQDDDVYFWTIHWSKERDQVSPMTLQMEEEGLKISIVVGLYDLFSSNELEKMK